MRRDLGQPLSPVASLQDQLVDMQKAITWAQQETNDVSAVQASDIAQQEEYLQT